MKLGPRGESLIKGYETLRLSSYMPTPNDKPTIGYGHTRGVKLGTTCTQEQAEKWFLEDTGEAVENVNDLNILLTQSMFDALVSLVYNAGPDVVATKNTIFKALSRGDYFAAWRGFCLWTKQDGKDLLGLARRRSQEMVLFMVDGLP